MADTQGARQRKVVVDEKSSATNTMKQDRVPQTSKAKGLSIIDVLRVLAGIALLSSALSYLIVGDSYLWGWKPWFSRWDVVKRTIMGPLVLTDEQLALYNGTDETLPIYVGLNGSIYDVSAAKKTYGPGGSYAFFAGKDSARAFITGCMKEDLTPDLRGVEDMFRPIDTAGVEPPKLSKGEAKIQRDRELKVARRKMRESLEHWEDMFSGKTGRPYFYVGRIQRPEGWLEALPRRELCAQARQSRPTRLAWEAKQLQEAMKKVDLKKKKNVWE